MEQKPPTQQIDLLELLAKIFTVIRNNKALVFLCPMLGVLVGLSLSYFLNKEGFSQSKNLKEVHSMDVMISTDLLSENEARFLIKDPDWGDLIPGLTNDERSKIVNLGSEVSKEVFPDGRHVISITITIKTIDETLLPSIQNGFVNYINKSEPFMQRSGVKQRICKEMIRKIDGELERLEQIQYKKEAIVYPRSLIVEWLEKKFNYQATLERAKTVQQIKGVQKVLTTDQLQSRRTPLLYGLAGMFAGLCILIFILFVKFFMAYYKNYQRLEQANL